MRLCMSAIALAWVVYFVTEGFIVPRSIGPGRRAAFLVVISVGALLLLDQGLRMLRPPERRYDARSIPPREKKR